MSGATHETYEQFEADSVTVTITINDEICIQMQDCGADCGHLTMSVQTLQTIMNLSNRHAAAVNAFNAAGEE